MFSLVTLAFAACSKTVRKSYNRTVSRAARVRLRKCCYRLILSTRTRPSTNPRNTKTCFLAAKHGHLECLRAAHEMGCSWNVHTCHVAARLGNVECLAFAYGHGCPTDPDTFRLAVTNKRSACVQFLMSTGRHHWNPELMYDAVINDRLETVAFLHENGCPWTSLLMGTVAMSGNLDIMRYAHEHGCPWQEDTSARAMAYENFDCMKYAIKHGCPLSRRYELFAPMQPIYSIL